MKLIDILVRELPKRGGWPERAEYVVQDCDDTEFYFFTGGPVRFDGKSWWFADVAERDDDSAWIYFEGINEISDDHDTSIISREQYEAALAASKPELDGRGLPPSGVEFEYLRGDFGADEGRWVRCTMKYAGDKFCIVHLEGEGESWLKHEGTKIRPIRSEADKKRENGVLSLAKAAGAMPFRYRETLSDGELLGSSWYELYDKIAAGEVTGIRID